MVQLTIVVDEIVLILCVLVLIVLAKKQNLSEKGKSDLGYVVICFIIFSMTKNLLLAFVTQSLPYLRAMYTKYKVFKTNFRNRKLGIKRQSQVSPQKTVEATESETKKARVNSTEGSRKLNSALSARPS